MRQVAIVEDSAYERDHIQKVLSDYQNKKGCTYDIRMFHNGKRLAEELEESPDYRPVLYLLDIEMPEMNGVETARAIREVDSHAHLIFITSYMNYAPETMEYKAFRYIAKEELEKKLPRALDSFELDMEWEDRGNEYYVIEARTHPERIRYRDILYIEREGKNVLIHQRNRKVSKERSSLAEVYEKIAKEAFAYCNQGCVVNISHIMGFEGTEIILRDGTRLQVSRERRNDLKEQTRRRWSGRA